MHIHAYIHTHIGPFILRRMLLLRAHHTFALLAWGDTWYYQECYWFRVVSLVRSVHQSRSIRHSAVWYSTVQCSVAWHSTVLQSTTQSSIVHVWYVAVWLLCICIIIMHSIIPWCYVWGHVCYICACIYMHIHAYIHTYIGPFIRCWL